MTAPFEPMRSGVYAPPTDLAACRQAAAAAGLSWIDVDLAGATDKQALLAAFKRDIPLPDHFGDNWDALADCLQDLPQRMTGGWVLYLTGCSAAGDSIEILLEILQDSAMYWSSRDRTFVVFAPVSGAAPWR